MFKTHIQLKAEDGRIGGPHDPHLDDHHAASNGVESTAVGHSVHRRAHSTVGPARAGSGSVEANFARRGCEEYHECNPLPPLRCPRQFERGCVPMPARWALRASRLRGGTHRCANTQLNQ